MEFIMEFVKINDELLMGKYPVTNFEYLLFCQQTNRSFPALIAKNSSLPLSDSFWQHPGVYVTAYDALDFCKHYGFSLPTSEEWYLAAAGKEKRKYPWGELFDVKKCNTYESEIKTTTPVGQYPEGATPEGCFDMAGNVWEWAVSEHEKYRGRFVLRGGSFFYSDLAACAVRYQYFRVTRYNDIGFRCCRRESNTSEMKKKGKKGEK